MFLTKEKKKKLSFQQKVKYIKTLWALEGIPIYYAFTECSEVFPHKSTQKSSERVFIALMHSGVIMIPCESHLQLYLDGTTWWKEIT